MKNRIVRVKSWQEPKNLIVKNEPKSIAYNIELGVPAGHLTGLRLILPVEGARYIFIETASRNHLRKTSIPLSVDNQGNLHIRDEDVVRFVRTETSRKDLTLHSY